MSNEIPDLVSRPIDKIFYINLDSRTDRREHMEAQIRDYALSDLCSRGVERFAAIANPGFGIWGCGMSHLAVLKLARDQGLRNVLILEDDLQFVIPPETLRAGITVLGSLALGSLALGSGAGSKSGTAFDVVMLAFNMGAREDIDIEGFQRVLYAQTASAYLVSSHYFQTLIDLYESAMPKLASTGEHWNYANDVVWRTLQQTDRWLAPSERWGKQMDGYSDNAQTFMAYNC